MANKNKTKQSLSTSSNKSYSSDGVGTGEKIKSTLTSGSKKKKTLKDLFYDGLKDIYSGETQLVEALPKMAKAADSEELSGAFTDHLEQTKRHVQRLEKIMKHLGVDPGGEKCEAMEGLIKEGDEIIERYEESPVRDAALIIAAQKVEHYEIASYGSLCELADVLGMAKIHDTLGRTLDEEEDTDMLLSEIAQDINDEAYHEEDFDKTKDEDEIDNITGSGKLGKDGMSSSKSSLSSKKGKK
jgi:ferritin-like metal-binding protein YciE